MILVLSTIIGTFILLSFSSLHYMGIVIREDSSPAMTSLVAGKAHELNSKFEAIERSVGAMKEYIEDNANPGALQHEGVRKIFMEEVAVRGISSAVAAGDVESLYFQMDPHDYGAKSGIFYTNDGYGGFASVDPTDILEYSPADREHVGWYYEPIDSGHPVWLSPYTNRNINSYMITYAAPVYVQGEILGVVGMDMNMSTILGIIENIDYENATCFLTDARGNLIYHSEYPLGLRSVLFNDELERLEELVTSKEAGANELRDFSWHGNRHLLTMGSLVNGMIIAVAAPVSELARPRVILFWIMLAILALVIIATAFVIWRVMRNIIIPIKELAEASVRIAKGELNVPIRYQANDEIGALSDSVRMMGRELGEYITYIHNQAYTDAMTGVGNKAAYMDTINLLDRKIHEGMADFSVVVFDVNGLKRINDNLGHEYGDQLISDAASVLKDTFGSEHTYRIGGDEFIVVMEHVSEKEVEELYKKYDEVLKEFNSHEKKYDGELSISKGHAVYIKDQDMDCKSVFQRADEEMYHNKEIYYQGRNDRRRR